MRASQINGCAFCIDIHSKDARVNGETEQRLYALSAWRETSFFTNRQRAALAWTEALTLITEGRAPDEVYAEVRKEFGEEELVNLSLAIITINGWNRLAICYRHGHRSWHQDAIRLFGLLGSRCSILTKSGRPSGRFKSGCASFFQILWRTTWTTFEDVCSLRTGYFGKRRNGFSKFRTGLPRVLTCPKTSPFTTFSTF